MKMIRSVSLLVLVACWTVAGARAENVAAVNEVLKLRNASMSDETMVAFIQSKNLNYDLSADDLVKLRGQGLSAAVLNAMLASGQGTATPTAQPAPVAIPQPAPVAVQPAVAAQPAVVAPAVVASPVTSPDVAYFYQELSPYGRWILVEDGQWCWQPSLVVSNPGWRPYWDKGHWIWTDQGWYWASDYSWGWAAFHYGRWHLHPHHGWVWLPDRVWGPAWVLWREGGDYCGWAPLPPGAIYDTAGARFFFHGKAVEASFDFGLGPVHFNFCFAREMGEPMRQHLHKEAEVRAVFERTTIINHYTVKRVVVAGETRTQVINHGIDTARIAAVKGRPFETVSIHDLKAPAPGRAHEHLDARDKSLGVYRPRFGGPH